MPCQRWAVRIETEDGARGEYVTHWVGTPSAFAQATMLAPHLPGRDPDAREAIWQEPKRVVRAYDHMGHGALDIALWDLAGKRRNVSVTRLLGGFRRRLPTYASTYHGQDEKGGHSYEMALIGPDMPNAVPPVYASDYSDQPEALGADGCVPVPDGPGLDVSYD